MKRTRRYANGNARRNLRKWIKEQGHNCYLCDYPINYDLRNPHPLAFVVDEVVPIAKGGSPLDEHNCKAAHRFCNQLKSDKTFTPQLKAEIKQAFIAKFHQPTQQTIVEW